MSHAAVDSTSILDRVAKSPWARTLWQGFIVDALGAIGLGLGVLLGKLDPTSEAFWVAAGGLVLKSLLTSLASYLTRLKVSPKEA
jgi:hypothetical protein